VPEAKVRTRGFGLRRNGQTPQSVLRNAFLVTFIIFLAIYPVLDKAFGFGKMGAFPTILIYTLLALGLNIVVGFAGLLDLGYAAFFAIGGYTAAFLTSPQSPLVGVFQTNFYVAMALSFLIAAAFGIILGAPTLRLRGDYLAIVTLAFGEIVPRAFLNLEQWTKGSKGINPIGRPTIPWLQDGQLTTLQLSNSDQTPWYYLIFCILGVSVFAIYRLAHSRIGRAWVAMREDELAASAMGIDLVQTKLLAFAIGASTSGLAGVLFASQVGFFNPDNFILANSILVVAYVVFGGMGSLPGVMVGAASLVWLQEFLRDQVPPPDRQMWVGALILLMMIFRPGGLIPARRRQAELTGLDRSPNEEPETVPADEGLGVGGR
jgi:ABC-type branched-subunit amino acid transport system permease subunit